MLSNGIGILTRLGIVMNEELKFIPYGEWHVKHSDDFDPDKRLYVDSDGNLITGILENFHYYKKDDPRNHRKVINGERV